MCLIFQPGCRYITSAMQEKKQKNKKQKNKKQKTKMKALPIIYTLLAVVGITCTNAFCMYDSSDITWTCQIANDFGQGSFGSFEKDIDPNQSECCNWQVSSCNQDGNRDSP